MNKVGKTTKYWSKYLPIEAKYVLMVRNYFEILIKISTYRKISSAYGKNKEDKNTRIIVEEAKKEISKLEVMLKMIGEFQNHAPQGCLKIQNKGNSTYFYQQYMNEQTKQWDRRYIKKEKISLAKCLAQKHYYMNVKPILEQNLNALKCFIKRYHPEEVQKIYDELCEERKMLITPLLESKEERIRKWNEEIYEKNNYFSETLKFETEQGEMVRSKSEVIIANILYQYRNDILYKYERPLKVMVDRKSKIIYPDFTILNIHTGKVTYWEHAGRMDDSNYANDFVRKINVYIANNLFPGKDVFFSYESLVNPLEISVCKFRLT